MQVRFLEDWDSGELFPVAALEFAEKASVARAFDSPGVEASIAEVDDTTAARVKAAVAALLRDEAPGGATRSIHAAARVDAGDLDPHVVDLMGCVTRETAAAAVRDYYKSAATSGVGSAGGGVMLRGALKRHRAADGTPTYAGFFRGLPLPTGPAERLERVLETIDWKEMGNVRAASIKVENSFSLGMATKTLQKSGPFKTPFAFKHGMGVWDGQSGGAFPEIE